jgi:hypothetical protein
VLELLAARRAGGALTLETWRAALRRELGEAGVRRSDAVLAGALVVPSDAAFGPGLRRTTKALRRYELGFPPDVLVRAPRIVRGLEPGSAAARAGLRDGDEIVRPVPQDHIQGDQAAYLRLRVRRAAEEFDLAYRPRGAYVDAYQWVLAEEAGADPDAEAGAAGGAGA